MMPVKKEFTMQTPLPVRPLAPHLQDILDRELGQTDQKVQQVFVPVIGGKWKIKNGKGN